MIKAENSQISLPVWEEFHVRNWLPDETFYSLCGRIHQVSGVIDSAVTCLRLFGHRLQGVQHDIPSRLNHFVERTGGMFGSVDEIIRMHSVLAFHFFLKPEQVRNSVCRSLAEGGVGAAKYRLGLLSSRFRAHHPLKLCPECALQDRADFGVAYWHLSHQYPGVWLCDRHGCLLREADAKANGVGRFLWFLPDYVASYRLAEERADPEKRERLRLMAEIARRIATCDMPIGIDAIPVLYAGRARDLLGVSEVRFRLRDLAENFSVFIRPLAGLEEFRYFATDGVDLSRYLARLLSGVRVPTHVLHHVMMIAFLFGDWDCFLEMAAQREISESKGNQPLRSATDGRRFSGAEKVHPKKEQALLLLEKGGRSVSAVAIELGVDIGTMQAWAAQTGIEVRRRPKSLQSGVRRAIVRELERGGDKRVVAKKFGVGEQAITRLLRTEVGLHKKWGEARSSLEVRKRREMWTALLIENPTLSISELRRMEPALYAWLYRNEGGWLRDSVSAIPRPIRNYGKDELWKERDLELSALVTQVALQLANDDRGKMRVTLQDIYRTRPEIRPMLSQLDKLPRTRKVLSGIGTKRILKKGLFDDADHPRRRSELSDE